VARMKFGWFLGVVTCVLAAQRAVGYRSLQAPLRRGLVLRSSAGYDGMTVVELKGMLRERGLALSGLKQVLIQRLQGIYSSYYAAYVS